MKALNHLSAIKLIVVLAVSVACYACSSSKNVTATHKLKNKHSHADCPHLKDDCPHHKLKDKSHTLVDVQL